MTIYCYDVCVCCCTRRLVEEVEEVEMDMQMSEQIRVDKSRDGVCTCRFALCGL